VDELAEDVHRQLMILHVLAGDRPAAIQQYKRCATVLQRELGVDPLPETKAVYEAMLKAH
jgi:DNA-binding SARP family transcriptional activator